ncbi:Methyltransferase-related protein [Salix suchowensis]|nr:Methyltransferase-related protein [Salix suchowensis]
MCPLRLILIFLSATLAGFFVIKNLKSSPLSATTDTRDDDNSATTDSNKSSPHASDSSSSSRFSKVKSGVEMGFWTLVDMASGKYLWRQLGFSSKRES